MDGQIENSHYTSVKIQPWDVMKDWYHPDLYRGFLLGCIIKRLQRHMKKDGLADLRKAQHELEALIEFESKLLGEQ